jgi:hypothetical protein
MNALIITEHAQVRMQQRAIPKAALDLLVQFGKRHYAAGAVRLDFDKRARRRVAAYYAPAAPPERLMNTYAVMSGDMVVTVGHRTKRFAWK